MYKLLFTVLCISALSACQLVEKPNNSIDALSFSINEVSRNIDAMEKQGLIGSEDESAMQVKLAYAHSLLLNPGAALLNDVACVGATDRLTCAELILQSALILLAEEE